MKAQVSSRGLSKKINDLSDIKDVVMPRAYQYFKRLTPVKSGNARKRTTLDNDKNIQAKYAYAGVLDSGSSRLAPQGMVKPTERQLAKLVKDYIKRLGA
jgi:hypothetical protein